MNLLNKRHNYKLDLVLLSIDEGITGYRDDSLEVYFYLKSNNNYFKILYINLKLH